MSYDFTKHIMICNSTGNQTINIIPAIQFGIKHIIIVSTDHTEKAGLSKRLMELSKKYKIKAEFLVVDPQEEKDFIKLKDKLLQLATSHFKIVWNISGGQKIPSIALQTAFQKRVDAGFKDDYILYLEANPPETWIAGSDYKMQKFRSCAHLSLDDILYLYESEMLPDFNKLYPNPSEAVKNKIEIGSKALSYYIESDFFREAFFGFMKPNEPDVRTINDIRDLIKKTLESVKPSVDDIKLTKEGYKNLEDSMKKIFSEIHTATDIEQCKRSLKKLKLIEKPSEIYQDYWNGIKRLTIDNICEKIEKNETKLISRDVNHEDIYKLSRQIKEIGGEIELDGKTLYRKNIKKFSSLGKNGHLFEWMVASSILDEINLIENKDTYISEIYHSVKTKKLGSADKHDSELDLVIVTKFGTIIIIELKTYEFSGNLAKAQEVLAYKKSGPYGKALIVGPLLTSMCNVNKKDDKKYPSYIEGPIISQQMVAVQNNIEYYLLDKMRTMLKKKLYIKEA